MLQNSDQMSYEVSLKKLIKSEGWQVKPFDVAKGKMYGAPNSFSTQQTVGVWIGSQSVHVYVLDYIHMFETYSAYD